MLDLSRFGKRLSLIIIYSMKSKNLPIILASLFIGLAVSVWSSYFIQFSHKIVDASYLPDKCTSEEYIHATECIPHTDYETWGAPLQFKKAQWVYEGGVENFRAGDTVSLEYSFSWPYFIANVLLVASVCFLILQSLKRLLVKKRNRSR